MSGQLTLLFYSIMGQVYLDKGDKAPGADEGQSRRGLQQIPTHFICVEIHPSHFKVM